MLGGLVGSGVVRRERLRTRRPSSVLVPASHRDLLDYPPVAALTTLMPDGAPHTSPVWCSFDGRHILVNTMRGFRKERNMRCDPRVTLLCYDPAEPLRSLEVRGRVVEMTEEGALEHLDAFALQYTGTAPFFGKVVPAEFAQVQTPVDCWIAPTHVCVLDAR